ncbi:Wadjet anti-phage system protein JetD domain-containing protein [Succinimonas amylolytica]|uniref:Wadjet anti-phage system protein JetD domain-containing protein n=1 Tax=Succinimonas amylolytica TaxID=83769 RepID=UPI000369F581|nr:Wadjet anti-phage system protein JetD domain-containing protein [Succinimonas amylolytica]
MILPREALERIARNEILNRGNLVKRLTGERPFPLEISLQVPTQKEIVADIGAYRDFIRLWREFRFQELLRRRNVEYRTVNGENVPARLVLRDWDDLMKVASDRQRREIQVFRRRTEKLGELSGCDSAVFCRLWRDLWDLPEEDFRYLCILYPQLRPSLGQGRVFIRALDVSGIDTKYIENHETLIWNVIRAVAAFQGQSPEAASLYDYLGVLPKPANFIFMRLMDPALASGMHGYTLFRVTAEELRRNPPPGHGLIVVENEQSGYMLPPLRDTVAIFGTGKNLEWARNSWIRDGRRTVYWGDVDSWGFQMLAEFRRNCGMMVPSILMHADLLKSHAAKMAVERMAAVPDGDWLTPEEKGTLKMLADPEFPGNRLEQEKIDQQLVRGELGKYFELL